MEIVNTEEEFRASIRRVADALPDRRDAIRQRLMLSKDRPPRRLARSAVYTGAGILVSLAIASIVMLHPWGKQELLTANERSIQGTWNSILSAGLRPPEQPYVRFDGRDWKASDGCNRAGGRFSLSSHRVFSAHIVGFRDLIGCLDGAPNIDSIVRARRAIIDNEEELRLLDADGRVIARYRRQ